MLPLSQEQKHQALMQLRSGVSTSKVGTLVGMSQPYVAHLKKDVRNKIERQRGGPSKASCKPRENALCHSCY